MAYGNVYTVFGQFFAPMANLWMERSHLTLPPIMNLSPLSVCAPYDDALIEWAYKDKTSEAVKLDVLKALDKKFKNNHSDYLLLDNSGCCLPLIDTGTSVYTASDLDSSPFMQKFFKASNELKEKATKNTILTTKVFDRLWRNYDIFIDMCLSNFDKDHIILIQSQVTSWYFDLVEAKFKVKTDKSIKMRKQIAKYDSYFVEKTHCRFLDTAQRFFQSKNSISSDMSLGERNKLSDFQLALEKDIVDLVEDRGQQNEPHFLVGDTVSDYIAKLIERDQEEIDPDYLVDKFTHKWYSFADVVAFSAWADMTGDKKTVRKISEAIVSNHSGAPYLHTKRLFDRNIKALNGYKYNYAKSITANARFQDKIVFPVLHGVYLEVNPELENPVHIFTSGRHNAIDVYKAQQSLAVQKKPYPGNSIDGIEPWDYMAFIDNGYTCGLDDIEDALESWEMYFERGRRQQKLSETS